MDGFMINQFMNYEEFHVPVKKEWATLYHPDVVDKKDWFQTTLNIFLNIKLKLINSYTNHIAHPNSHLSSFYFIIIISMYYIHLYWPVSNASQDTLIPSSR